MLLQLRGVGGSSGGVGRGSSGGAGGVLDGLRGVLRLALRAHTHTWIMGIRIALVGSKQTLTSASACALPAWKDCSMFDIADDLLAQAFRTTTTSLKVVAG